MIIIAVDENEIDPTEDESQMQISEHGRNAKDDMRKID